MITVFKSSLVRCTDVVDLEMLTPEGLESLARQEDEKGHLSRAHVLQHHANAMILAGCERAVIFGHLASKSFDAHRFTRGQPLRLEKGMRYRTTAPEGEGVVGRNYTVTLFDTVNGFIDNDGTERAPVAEWVGAGGYYRYVPINDILMREIEAAVGSEPAGHTGNTPSEPAPSP